MNALLIAVQITLGAIAGVIATVLLQDQLERSVVVLLGRSWGRLRRHAGGIEGYWYSVFWFRGIDGAVHPVSSILRIRRVGQRVAMRTELGVSASYDASGSISLGRFVTCTWRNDAGGNIYNGACQFVRSPEGDVLAGSWVGWNKDQHVSMGPWLMVLVGRSPDLPTFDVLLQEVELTWGRSPSEISPGGASVATKIEESLVRYSATYRDADWSDALAYVRGRGDI